MKRLMLLSIAFSMFVAPSVFATELLSKSPDGAKVYIISPANNQVVSETFKVQFGLSGMGVVPAGMHKTNAGHHHILIDTDTSAMDLTQPIPATDKIKHFGGGQTETELTLPKGKHTLQLLLGNYVHIPHQKPVISKKIMVIVE